MNGMLGAPLIFVAMKACKRCEIPKSVDDFYFGDSSCKECRKLLVREYRIKNYEKYRLYEKSRANAQHRVSARAEYQKTENGKKSLKKYRAKWLVENKAKRSAHVILNNAVRDKKITKPSICQQCGSTGKIQGHHDDYSLPLCVSWLCSKCHSKIHAKCV